MKRIAVPIVLTAAGFLLGWLFARVDSGSQAPKSTPIPPASVHIQLDAGAVTLLPEGGLRLEPIEPLDAGLPEP